MRKKAYALRWLTTHIYVLVQKRMQKNAEHLPN